MKKIVTSVLVSIFIIASSIPAYAADKIGVTIDNKPVPFDTNTGYPFIDSSGRTLVPLRQTMEAGGFSVVWNSKDDIATVSDGDGTKVYVKIGDNYITKEINNNGTTESSRIKNDTFAQVVNHRTYLPIRAVLECFGASVTWNSTSHNVVVNTSGVSSTMLSAEQIYAKYSPAIFYIELYDANGEPISSGSGFFIDSKGTAITNYHVIEGASSAKIMTTDDKVYDVEGVYDFDKTLDIAKIKIKGSGFNYVNIANSGTVVGGSKTYAIGSPLGLDNTISEGIISNPNRIIDNITYYQITTPISHGSSGGALFDKNGNVIGITCGGISEGQNLNLAIPITNINKLSKTNITKLSKITTPKKEDNVFFQASKSNITLKVGESSNILVSYANYDSDVECNYVIEDETVVSATWGDWNENTIPLNIKAIRKGEKNIIITLNDSKTKKVLASQTVHVNVTQGYSTPYYNGFYPAPDLGAIYGVPVYIVEDSDCMFYCYYAADIYKVSPVGKFIEEYSDIVMENGFDFTESVYDEDGDCVICYRNNYYDLNLFTMFKTVDGIGIYVVTVMKD